jgi:hypothetical protein
MSALIVNPPFITAKQMSTRVNPQIGSWLSLCCHPLANVAGFTLLTPSGYADLEEVKRDPLNQARINDRRWTTVVSRES